MDDSTSSSSSPTSPHCSEIVPWEQACPELKRAAQAGHLGSDDPMSVVNTILLKTLPRLENTQQGIERQALESAKRRVRNLAGYQRKRESRRAKCHVKLRAVWNARVQPDPRDEVEHRDMLERLSQILGALPRKDWFLLERRYADGASEAEIASELGVSVSTVRYRLNAVLVRTRAALREE